MITLEGSSAGSGIAIGTAFVLERTAIDSPYNFVDHGKQFAEVQFLKRVLKDTADNLRTARDEVPDDSTQEISAFLDAHVLMVEDPKLLEETIRIIHENSVSAETALMIHRNELFEVFDSMEDEYLRSKKYDVDQVIQQIRNQMLFTQGNGHYRSDHDLSECILVAHDLTPADTVRYKNLNLKGFVTNLGSSISHVAILARSFRIPSVVGLHEEVQDIPHGATIALDGSTGEVFVDPDEQTLSELERRDNEYQDQHQRLLAIRNLKSISLDGDEIELLTNVELPEEIESAYESGASGVGLYRTEYLFMQGLSESPTEDKQFEAYRKVIQALKKVTVRTLDIGADKQVDGGRAQGTVATNPALGLRAIRFCLRSEDLFRTQLRAIFRAAVYGEVQCMIPMLSNLEELEQVRALVDQVKEELRKENVEHNPEIPIGGMIEVPAAAITAEQFAQHLDFLSIGTNDLIQYTLAIDRVDDNVNYLYDPLHPSVLTLVKRTIDAGRKFNKPVSLCGEMASNPSYTRLLLGMGLKIFSMDPATVLEVKQVIRKSSVDQASHHVDEIINCQSSTMREMLLKQLNELRFLSGRVSV